MQERVDPPVVAAIVVAAGRGVRAMRGPHDLPKQYRTLAGRPVLAHTIERFTGHDAIDHVVCVIHGDDAAYYQEALAAIGGDGGQKILPPVTGGRSRQESVANGLRALAGLAPDLVLIHDAVRPFVSAATISTLILALRREKAVLAGAPVVDTIWRAGDDNHIREPVSREGLWRAATPQGFRFAAILAAHEAAASGGRAHDFTDDAAVSRWAGDKVMLVEGNPENTKLTLPADFAAAEARLKLADMQRLADIRVGTGYDVHAFADGDHVTLCGIDIAHDRRLSGHSDADVALHAVTDAILGALGDGDIGQHFPPGDPQWRGAPSRLFVEDAIGRVAARGGVVAHIDVSLIAEYPRIGPHREAMRARLAEIAGVTLDRVGIKATTNEKMGFVGRGEGLAAIATVTVRLPLKD